MTKLNASIAPETAVEILEAQVAEAEYRLHNAYARRAEAMRAHNEAQTDHNALVMKLNAAKAVAEEQAQAPLTGHQVAALRRCFYGPTPLNQKIGKDLVERGLATTPHGQKHNLWFTISPAGREALQRHQDRVFAESRARHLEAKQS